MWLNVISAFLGLFTILYFWITRKYGYFRSRGVPEVPSLFPFGADESARLFTGRVAFPLQVDTIYKQYKKLPMVGYFAFDKPVLVVNDLELAKLVMIKDFDHFVNRRPVKTNNSVESNRYSSSMLFFMHGDRWRNMRNTFSPIFTSGKLRGMAKILEKVGDDFVVNLTKKAENNVEFDSKDLMVNFMLDSIATCGFGVDANSLIDENSKFKAMVSQFSGLGKHSSKMMMRMLFVVSMPRLASLLKVPIFDAESMAFFVDIIRQTLAHRQKENSDNRRNDFVDLTLDALKNKLIKQEDEEEQFEKDAMVKPVGKSQNLTEDELDLYLISNLIQMFTAGFDGSSTILSVACFYLGKNPDIQEKLLNEIIENEDDLDKMDYLDMFIKETLRMYPLSLVERVCTKAYKVPGTDFTVPVGMLVQIPSGAIMKDPEYFENPDSFDPEGHFGPESSKNRSPYAFLPFGQGPRNCIGMRFAQMCMKICLVKLVKGFRVVLSPKTKEKPIQNPMSSSMSPLGGVWIKVEKR